MHEELHQIIKGKKGNLEPRKQIIEQYNLSDETWLDERGHKFQPTYNHNLALLCNCQRTWFHNVVEQKVTFKRRDNVFCFNSSWYSAIRHIWDVCSVLLAWVLKKAGFGLYKTRKALLKNTRRYFIFSLTLVVWAITSCMCQCSRPYSSVHKGWRHSVQWKLNFLPYLLCQQGL